MTVERTDFSQGGPFGLVLSVEGSEYVFTGPGVASVEWTDERDPDWCTDDVEWVVLEGFLVPEGIKWNERVNGPDGELEHGNISFLLHDGLATAGTAAGFNVCSWLASPDESLTGSVLRAAIDDNDTSIPVLSSTPFSPTCVIWLNREAIKVTGTSGGNTLTGGVRGVYGSLARGHGIVNDDAAERPEVFARFPGLDQRRVILWAGAVEGGVVTDPVPLWRGIVQEGPRLHAEGAKFELPCDGMWTSLGDVRLGLTSEACRVQGYQAAGGGSHTLLNVSFTATQTTQKPAIGFAPDGYYATLKDVCTAVASKFLEDADDHSLSNPQISLRSDQAAGSVAIDVGADPTTTHVTLTANWNGRRQASARSLDATRAQTSVVTIPPCYQRVFPGNTSTLRFASVAMLPSVWVNRRVDDDFNRYTRSTASLISTGESAVVVLKPDTIDAPNRRVTGILNFYESNGTTGHDQNSIEGVTENGADGHQKWVVRELSFGLGLTIDTSDWLHAFRYAVVGDTLLTGTPYAFDLDARDFDFTNEPAEGRVYFAAGSVQQRRQLVLDGTLTVRDYLSDNFKLTGCGVTLRHSRFAFDQIRVPLLSDVSDDTHTFTIQTQVGKSRWHRNSNGIVNVARVEVGNDRELYTWVVVDAISKNRFKSKQELFVRPRGIQITPELRAAGPKFLQDQLLRKVLSLWGYPVESLFYTGPIELIDQVFLLDVVTVSEWLAPNGQGARGWVNRKGVIMGRDLDWDEGTITFEVLCWPRMTRVSGFAPCAKIASITDDVLTLASGYLANVPSGSPDDFAGSNVDGYESSTLGTEEDDEGAGRFKPGDRIQLRQFDSASPATPYSGIIESVDTGAGTITLTANVPTSPTNWPSLCSSGWVNIAYDDYDTSGIQAAQKNYVFVGDRATVKIAGTNDSNFRWAA